MLKATHSQLTQKKVRFLLFVVLSGGLILAGCAGFASTSGNTKDNGASAAPSITTQPVSADVTVGQTATFFVATTGTAPFSYQWQKNNTAISGGTSSTYTTPPATTSDNRAQYRVVVSNSAGSATSNAATLNVSASAGVAIVVSPSSTTVAAGATQQFAATVTGNSNTAVSWSITGGAGCSGAACGTISAGGLYTAPASVLAPATLSVTVTSLGDPTKSASASVTLVAATAVLLSISPTSASVPAASTDSFTATVAGTSNTAGAWSLNGAGCSGSTCGTLASSSLAAVYTAPSLAPSPASVKVVATSMADPSKTASATVTIMPVVFVTVTPASTSVVAGATQQLNASVVGNSNTAVTWTVQGAGCNGAACGTVNGPGLYTAPPAVPSPDMVTVTATSSADPSKTGSATLSIFSASSAGTAYGLNIPTGHPRLFWNAGRVTTARGWVASTIYAGLTTSPRPLDDYDVAFTCFVMNVSAACTQAINDAASFAPASTNGGGTGDDNMRALGEQRILIRDWLSPGCAKASCLSSAQVATFDTNWNLWQSNQDAAVQTWGNVGMPVSNYFCGQFRNDFDFGIASYNENTSADANLKYGVMNRWNDMLNFVSPTAR